MVMTLCPINDTNISTKLIESKSPRNKVHLITVDDSVHIMLIDTTGKSNFSVGAKPIAK